MTAWRGRAALVAVVVLAAGVLSAGETSAPTTPAAAGAPVVADLPDLSSFEVEPPILLSCVPGPGPACFQCCYQEYKACLAAGGDTQECADAYLQCRNDCIP